MSQSTLPKNLSEFQKKQARAVKLFEFEKQIGKEILEDARKPEWVKMQEYGDYIPGIDDGEPPNNDFDMEPDEDRNEEQEEN